MSIHSRPRSRDRVFAEHSVPQPNDDWRLQAERIHADALALLGRALAIRQVDAGPCNGFELEIHALNNLYYNIEGQGIKFVASPRHADMLLVTGPVARNMEIAVRRYLRRKLCKLRARGQCHPGRRRGPRLPAAADRYPARNTDCRFSRHRMEVNGPMR